MGTLMFEALVGNGDDDRVGNQICPWGGLKLCIIRDLV